VTQKHQLGNWHDIVTEPQLLYDDLSALFSFQISHMINFNPATCVLIAFKSRLVGNMKSFEDVLSYR
jgi:hypothetical protein